MKAMNDYTNDAMTRLFEETKTFFAFSDQQFDEAVKRLDLAGLSIRACGNGMYMPTDNVKAFDLQFSNIAENGRIADLAENGREKIIERELHNYECFYVNDISDAVSALYAYSITRAEILEVYEKLRHTVDL